MTTFLSRARQQAVHDYLVPLLLDVGCGLVAFVVTAEIQAAGSAGGPRLGGAEQRLVAVPDQHLGTAGAA